LIPAQALESVETLRKIEDLTGRHLAAQGSNARRLARPDKRHYTFARRDRTGRLVRIGTRSSLA
jgi:hypothetical protein